MKKSAFKTTSREELNSDQNIEIVGNSTANIENNNESKQILNNLLKIHVQLLNQKPVKLQNEIQWKLDDGSRSYKNWSDIK